jgi:hypothetical protein
MLSAEHLHVASIAQRMAWLHRYLIDHELARTRPPPGLIDVLRYVDNELAGVVDALQRPPGPAQ